MSHSSHSSMVRFWRAKQTVNAFGIDWKEGEMFILMSPHEGHRVSVSFAKYPDHPEHTRVRSTNWRCEHEPNGVYSTEDARAFFSSLLKAGFVRDTDTEAKLKEVA